MPRPGAFAANFTPEVLVRLEICKKQGKQYTKVLQLLAEMYLETDGAVLMGVSSGSVDPDKRKRQVQVESPEQTSGGSPEES